MLMPKNPSAPVATKLKIVRERSGLSMAEVAKSLGFRGASSYQRYEDASLFTKKYLPLDLTEKLARALVGRGVPPITAAEIMALAGKVDGVRQRMIRLVGHVGAGAQVIPIDDMGDEVPCPWAELGAEAVAVKVRGDSMIPAYYDGDLLYYDEKHTDFTHFLGRECVVALSDGRRFVKELRRTQSGQWYLHSHNSEPIVGVVIEWAAKVRLIQRAQ